MVRKHFGLTMSVIAGAVAVAAINVSSAFANHPVLVEGNCNGAGTAPRTAVTPGTCGDYDGDGRVGTAEDTDEADRVFGTINAALGAGTGAAAGSGANQNGSVTIVASGVYPEIVLIGQPVGGFAGGTPTPGNVTLQAAPGVEANIDAVLAGEPGTTPRQGAPGIIVNMPSNRQVVIRNITSRNWTTGIEVIGTSRVAINTSRFENNTNYGIHAVDSSRVAISNSEVHATGYRLNPATGNFPSDANRPDPGSGIEFEDRSTGTVFNSVVTGSFGAGISDETDADGSPRSSNVCVAQVNVFDNNPNFDGVALRARASSCVRDSDGDFRFKVAKRK